MAGHGLIGDKLDLKFLLLFILARFDRRVDVNILNHIAIKNGKVDYFACMDALAELRESGHITLTDEAAPAAHITEKGAEAERICYTSLPYSVRLHAAEDIRSALEKLRREESIAASVSDEGGMARAALSLRADHGTILSLELLLPSAAEAEAVCGRFRQDAEGIYNRILTLLTAGENEDDGSAGA